MAYFGTTVAEKSLAGARVLLKEHVRSETIPVHEHEHPYLSLVLRGRYTELLRSGKVELAAGFAAMHPAGERHEDRFYEDANLLVLELPSRLSSHRAFADSGVVEGPAIARIGAILRRELQQGDDVSEMIVEGVIHELGALLVRSRHPSRTDGTVAIRADAIIRERFSESISLATIADALATHPAHLSRTFHQKIGCTVGDRIRERRVEHVCSRLASDTSLVEIAHEAGFADQSHMTRTFRRFIGMTPGAYRQTLLGV